MKHGQEGVSVPGTSAAGVAPTWARVSPIAMLESCPVCRVGTQVGAARSGPRVGGRVCVVTALIRFSRPVGHGLPCAPGTLTFPGSRWGCRPLSWGWIHYSGEPLVPARVCPWNWLLMVAGGSLTDLPSVHARRADVTPEGPLQVGDAGLFCPQVELWPSPPGGSSGWRS